MSVETDVEHRKHRKNPENALLYIGFLSFNSRDASKNCRLTSDTQYKAQLGCEQQFPAVLGVSRRFLGIPRTPRTSVCENNSVARERPGIREQRRIFEVWHRE